MFFTRISINNPVLATMMMAALMVLGLFSLNRLRVDQFPDIEFPVVVVTTEYPGATPESVESDITRPVEEAVNTVSGIKSLYSRSYEGQSVVIVEFDLTVEPSRAAQDVREKIAIVKVGFRKEVKEPRISRFDPADRPIISFAVSSETRSARDVTTLSDQLIKKRIENVRGVGSVAIVGGIKRDDMTRSSGSGAESEKNPTIRPLSFNQHPLMHTSLHPPSIPRKCKETAKHRSWAREGRNQYQGSTKCTTSPPPLLAQSTISTSTTP